MKRLLHTFFRLFELRYSPRVAVLEVALDLQRLSHRLFEITQSIKRPADVDEMLQDRVPRTVEAEIWGIVDFVRDGCLAEAISELVKVSQVTEEDIRKEFFARHKGSHH